MMLWMALNVFTTIMTHDVYYLVLRAWDQVYVNRYRQCNIELDLHANCEDIRF